jgi:hypothetical protein
MGGRRHWSPSSRKYYCTPVWVVVVRVSELEPSSPLLTECSDDFVSVALPNPSDVVLRSYDRLVWLAAIGDELSSVRVTCLVVWVSTGTGATSVVEVVVDWLDETLD